MKITKSQQYILDMMALGWELRLNDIDDSEYTWASIKPSEERLSHFEERVNLKSAKCLIDKRLVMFDRYLDYLNTQIYKLP